MTQRGQLVVISGPSGVGKGTVLQCFLQGSEDCALSVSATTRPPRPGEQHGRAYYFMTRQEFLDTARRGGMLEYAEYGGNFYGTPADPVETQLRDGKHVILEIEVQGALQVRKLRPDAVLVFLAPPGMEALRQRLRGRGTEPEEEIAARLAAAKEEIARAGEYDYIVINDTVENSSRKLRAIITASDCAANKMKMYLQEVSGYA